MASTSRPRVRRGEVWIVALDPVVGSEQAKTRPCVVIQRDAANERAHTTIVVPFTGAARRRTSVAEPVVPQGTGGLTRTSAALCHQIRVVDRLRFRTRIGSLDGVHMEAIGRGIAEIVDLAP